MKWQVPKIWSGDCWVIGGGSSISEQFNIPGDIVPETMEEFKAYGDYMDCIHKFRIVAVNISAFLGDWVDVAYWADADTYTEYKAQFDAFSGLKVSSAGKFNHKRFQTVKYIDKSLTKGITKNRKQVSWASRNSGCAAINLAYHLGATRIFVLGLDMYNFEEGTYRRHFHTGYPSKTKTPTLAQLRKGAKHPRRPVDTEKTDFLYKRQSMGWGRVAKDAEELGIEIFNVNPKSCVNAFEKMNLEQAMEMINETDK